MLATLTFERDELGPLEIGSSIAALRLAADMTKSIADELEALGEELEPVAEAEVHHARA